MPLPPTSMHHNDLVAVTIVTYNSGEYITRCLDSVLEQTHPHVEIIVVDNNSQDQTRDLLDRFAGRCRVVYNSENMGFAAAQNQAIALSRSAWVLALNPDVLLMPDFIAHLVEAGQTDSRIGTVCGKLLTIQPGFVQQPDHPLIDSTGIFFTPALRHLDRGSQAPDNGDYRQFEYVFGATAAAALYRRTMIEDVSVDGEFFDSDFFVYREDADVAWRAQLLGWQCLYTPRSQAYHVRSVLPGNRRRLSPFINMHSVKNRFLMRIKNITPEVYRRNFVSITARDLVVLGCCLTIEHTSLRAFWEVVKTWRRAWRKRQQIMARRRVDESAIASWFSYTPVSRPAPKPPARAMVAKVRSLRRSG